MSQIEDSNKKLHSSLSPKKSTQEEFQAASAAVELEYNAVKRLKRLSIGNSLNFDPDLPPTDTYYLDNQIQKSYNSDLHRSKSKLSTFSNSSIDRSFASFTDDDDNDDDDDDDDDIYDDAAEPIDVVSLSVQNSHEDLDFNDDNVDFLDLDPDASFTDCDSIWVPANAHPKISPENFRKHIQGAVDEVNSKLQRSGSIKSSLKRETSLRNLSNLKHINESNNVQEKVIDDIQNKENILESKNNELNNIQVAKPSLKELTVQLETLSKRAGLDNNDAITLARSLSTRSIGITKIEEDVYSQNEHSDIPNSHKTTIQDENPDLNRVKSRKILLRNNLNRTRESLFIKDDKYDDDNDDDASNENNDLIEMDNTSNHPDFVSNLRRGGWTNYRRQQNSNQDSKLNLPNLPNLPVLPNLPKRLNLNRNKNDRPHVHVYKDIQKIHNAQKPLVRPQLEPIKSKTPLSRLPDLPSSSNSSTNTSSLRVSPTSSSPKTSTIPLNDHSRSQEDLVNSRNVYQQGYQHTKQNKNQNHQYSQQRQLKSQNRNQQYQQYQQQKIQHRQRQQQQQQKQQQLLHHTQQSSYTQQRVHDPVENRSNIHPQQSTIKGSQKSYRQHDQNLIKSNRQQHMPLPYSPVDMHDQSGMRSPTNNKSASFISNNSSQSIHGQNKYMNGQNSLSFEKPIDNEKFKVNESKTFSGKSEESPNNLKINKERFILNNKSQDTVTSSEYNNVIGVGSEHKSSYELIKDENISISTDNTTESEKEKPEKDGELGNGKKKEKDNKFKSKSSFSSFFKIKRDKPRTPSNSSNDLADEPKIKFKVKRSHSHSSDSSLNSPKDFKSFFGGRKEKEKEKEREIETETENENESETENTAKREEFGSVSSVDNKNLSSSPKPGVGIFSSHSNILLKNKSSESLTEVNKKNKSNTNINGQNIPIENFDNLSLTKDSSSQRQKTISNGTLNKTPINSSFSGEGNGRKNLTEKGNNGQSTSSEIVPEVEMESNIGDDSKFTHSINTSMTSLNSTGALDSPTSSDSIDNFDTVDMVTSEYNGDNEISVSQENGPLQEQGTVAIENDPNELIKRSLKETLQQNERPYKPNQPLEMRDSAFGFPLPPVSHSTLVMLDHRFPVHVERAIYRLSHLKLAEPKRALRQQVLLSNFMYSYLNLVNHTLWIQSKEEDQKPEVLTGSSSNVSQTN